MIFAGAAVTVVIGRDMQDLVQRKMSPHLHDRIVMIPNWSESDAFTMCPRRERVPAGASFGWPLRRSICGRLGQKHNLEPLIHAARLLSDTRAPSSSSGTATGGRSSRRSPPISVSRTSSSCLTSRWSVWRKCSPPRTSPWCVSERAHGGQRPEQGLRGYRERDSDRRHPRSRWRVGQMVKETGCGVLVDPMGEEISAVDRDLMVDPVKRSAMSAAARQIFLEKYTLSKAAEQIINAALSSMLNGSPNGGERVYPMSATKQLAKHSRAAALKDPDPLARLTPDRSSSWVVMGSPLVAWARGLGNQRYPRGGAPVTGAVPVQNRRYRLKEDPEVPEEAPFHDVPVFEEGSLALRDLAPATNRPEARHPRLDAHVRRRVGSKALYLFTDDGPRSHQAHGPSENVEQLGKLVQAGFPQDTADACHARVVPEFVLASHSAI